MLQASTTPPPWLSDVDWVMLSRAEYDSLRAALTAWEGEQAQRRASAEAEDARQAALARVPKRRVEEILREIQKFASWDGREAEVEQGLAELRLHYPGQEDEARRRIATGQDIKTRLDSLYQTARTEGADSPKVRRLHRDFCKDYEFLRNQADKALKNAEAARRRRDDERRLKASSPLTQVRPRQQVQAPTAAPKVAPSNSPAAPVPEAPRHAQDIRGLTPAPRWTMVIDETGDSFAEAAQTLENTDRHLGRWIGLLVPETGHGLPSLTAGWHAAEQGLTEIDRVVQAVLDARVGVFGLTFRQLPPSAGDRWAAGVLGLIDWVLRLLPLDGPTKLDVRIEQRDQFSHDTEWPALARDALRRLALAYPERATRIDLGIRIVDKMGSPFNGYVDALAFTWGSPTEASRARLKASGLLGCCFLDGDAGEILRTWEWLDRGIAIRPADWSQLLAQPDAGIPGGLTATILQRLGEACRHDAGLWRGFVEETRRHMDSKAMRLATLGSQIDWLEEYRPATENILPRLRLLWLTARLAQANHFGAAEQDWMAEMQDLGARLMDEDAPLVCWADLHLAVNATNRYDFERAIRCLDRWRDLPPSVPGLRYWAQACSSLGQHAAFMDRPEQARTCFHAALQAFDKLSDPEDRQKQAAQTAVYFAIVEIDHGDDAAARKAVEQAVGPLPGALERLAAGDADRDKYRHHLALRWLVYRGGAAERQTYLAHRERWRVGYGHPWPLIQLYRGMLLADTDLEAARDLAEAGYALAWESRQGPAVQLIGACCRAVAGAWGKDWPEGPGLLDELHAQLPAAKPQIDILRAYLASPAGRPLDLLRRVLPFNFR